MLSDAKRVQSNILKKKDRDYTFYNQLKRFTDQHFEKKDVKIEEV
jgi:hypothetical protein